MWLARDVSVDGRTLPKGSKVLNAYQTIDDFYRVIVQDGSARLRTVVRAADLTTIQPVQRGRVMASMIAFMAALAVLRRHGIYVAQTDIPGLTIVGDRELTMGQVVSLAKQLTEKK